MTRNEFGSLMIMALITYNVNTSMGTKLYHGALAQYIKCSNSVSSTAKHIDTTLMITPFSKLAITTVAYTHYRILFCHKNEWSLVSCGKADEQRLRVKWNKPRTER